MLESLLGILQSVVSGAFGLVFPVVGHLRQGRRRRLFGMLVAVWLLSIAAVAIVGSIWAQALAP